MGNVKTAFREFSLRNEIYSGSSVTGFVPDANGNPTSTKVTFWANQTSGAVLANPQTLDGEGKFQQPVYFDAPTVLAVASAFAGAHNTGVIRPSLDTADVSAAAASAAAAATSASNAAASAAAAANSAADDLSWRYWRHEAIFSRAI